MTLKLIACLSWSQYTDYFMSVRGYQGTNWFYTLKNKKRNGSKILKQLRKIHFYNFSHEICTRYFLWFHLLLSWNSWVAFRGEKQVRCQVKMAMAKSHRVCKWAVSPTCWGLELQPIKKYCKAEKMNWGEGHDWKRGAQPTLGSFLPFLMEVIQ